MALTSHAIFLQNYETELRIPNTTMHFRIPDNSNDVCIMEIIFYRPVLVVTGKVNFIVNYTFPGELTLINSISLFRTNKPTYP